MKKIFSSKFKISTCCYNDQLLIEAVSGKEKDKVSCPRTQHSVSIESRTSDPLISNLTTYTVPWVGLMSGIVVFPSHTHLFSLNYMYAQMLKIAT